LAYIGKIPTSVPLTSSDIADGIISSAKIADATIVKDDIANGVLPAPNRNIIINGDMSIAQRATSVTGVGNGDNSCHTVDRFSFYEEGATSGEFTMSQDTDVPTGYGFAKSTKLDCTTADSSLAAAEVVALEYKFEGLHLQHLKKGTSNAESLTLSFWVKTNKTGTYVANFYDNDNDRHTSQNYTVSSSNTWEKKTITFAPDTSGTLTNDNTLALAMYFILGAGTSYTSGSAATAWETFTGNANKWCGGQNVNVLDHTDNNFWITGVQLETGTAASDFEFVPFDINLRRCQRYYQKSYDIGTFPGNADANNNISSVQMANSSSSTANNGVRTRYAQRLRANPTATLYAPDGTSGNLNYCRHGAAQSEVSGTITGAGTTSLKVYTGNASGMTSGDAIEVFYHYTADAEL